jgi:cytidylate kinase
MENIELKNRRVVAIDGGTATGKGRLISELSQAMRMRGVPVTHLSTGSLYRAVAYCGMEMARAKDLPVKLDRLGQMNPEKLLAEARRRGVEMHGGEVWLDGAAASVDEQLKGPGVGTGASVVGALRPVRDFVNEATRRQINEFDGYLLIDGRDITHTVVPDAPLKLLLTVSPEVAATRSSEHSLAEILARDEADRMKTYGNLRRAADPGENVIVLATDVHTPETARDHVYKLMRKVWAELPEI